MTTWSTRVVGTSFAISFILLFATFGDASVTWRRVTKPTLKVQTQVPQSTHVAKHITKSPITWKRSTIVRRSTTDDVESTGDEDEFDELDEASSEKDEDLKELEIDSEIKPLVPGSRPGFWFDSSRRKKPASLLRPGARRNSLFPTRSSTTTTITPTTVSVTAATAIPRTPPPVLKSRTKNVNTKVFGRNTSTSSPVVFRRRLKTTRTPKASSTTESLDLEENTKDNLLVENHEPTESEKEVLSTGPKNSEPENDNMSLKRPKFSSRRRYYNGTRLSWIKQNSVKNSRTTAVPQQLTTASPTPDFETFSPKFSRTRMKIKTSTTQATLSRTKQTTVKPTPSTTTNDKKNASAIRNIVGTRSNSTKKTVISKVQVEKEISDLVEETTPSSDNYHESRQVLPEEPQRRLRTTVEPFFLTKEYGRIVTAVPEITQKMEVIKPIPMADSEPSKSKEHVVPATRKDKEQSTSALPEEKKENKRTRTQVTEAPKTTTPAFEEPENTGKEYEYEIEDIDSSVEYVDDFKWKYKTTESPKPSTKKIEHISEKRRGTKSTSTIRPVTLPSMPTIDPNSNNAYVVWSVGHGGSGWSYQRHGGKVQWSAQNSEAEGDSWSVMGNDEIGNTAENLNYQWKPIVNLAPNYKKNEKFVSKTKEESMPYSKIKPDAHKNSSPVTYTPKLSFKNETILNFMKISNSERLPNQDRNLSSWFSISPEYASTTPVEFDNSTPASSTLHQTTLQDQKVSNFVSQTSLPVLPTQEVEEFEARVKGTINPYPTAPDYPYVAEIRETYTIPTAPTTAPTTKLFVQEYATKITDIVRENKPTTPLPISQGQQQFMRERERTSHPTILPHTENVSPYIGHIRDALNRGMPSVPPLSQRPAVKTSPPNYHSQIPPELARAVIKEKKWHVVGSGGEEGWSLLNEDGMLEWKIHNVDGHWRVSSADQLLKTHSPIQQVVYKVDNQESQTGNYEPNFNNEQYPPKVWTLEDDYEKWRAVSAERGIPVGETIPETSISSQEYDYDSAEYNGEYYSDDDDDDDDYYNSDPVSADVTPYEEDEDYRSRPYWGNGESLKSNSPSQEDYPQFSTNIEAANSREDAIAAWKSLMAQQGHWKLSDRVREKLGSYLSLSPEYLQEKDRKTGKKDVTPPPRHDNDRKGQKDPKINSENFEFMITRRRHENYGRDQQTEKQVLIRERENEGIYKNKPQDVEKENNGYFQEKPDQKYNVNEEIKETKLPTLKVKLYETKDETVPESTEQKSGYHERIRPEEVYFQNTRQENNQNLRKDKPSQVGGRLSEHLSGSKDEIQRYSPRNPAEVDFPKTSRHDTERTESYKVRERNEKVNPERLNKNQGSRDREHSRLNMQNPGKLIERNSQKDNERLPETRVHARGQDHSKLETLINKLEAIKRESNGRAVIDLTALLKQMKQRRNITATTSHQPTNSNAQPQVRRIVESQVLATLENPSEIDFDPLPVRNHKNLPFEASKKSQDDHPNPHNVRGSDREPTRSKSQSHHRLRHPNQSNRKKNLSARLQTSKAEALSNNGTTTSKNGETYSTVRTKEQSNERHRASEKLPQKVSHETRRYAAPVGRHPDPSVRSESNRRLKTNDSPSSEETVVDLRGNGKVKSSASKKQRPSRKQSRKRNHPKPIVMKAETVVEDEEDGSRKNRKIIVIDYAAKQNNKSSIDKKDLELIIRNVRHRRSGIHEESEK